MNDDVDKIKDIQNAMIECYRQFPTIVLGSGASIPYGLPSTSCLSEYILANMSPKGKEENEIWEKIKLRLEQDQDIESVLSNHEIIENDTLAEKILKLIWQIIREKDMNVLKRSALGQNNFELSKLLSGMFHSSHNEAHIITTNYDRIVEYACNSKGILYQTGFPPGYLQKWKNPEGILYATKTNTKLQKSRVVNIHKVHGSLDWFTGPNNVTMCLPFNISSDDFSPLILIPGVRKFQRAHDEPFRTIIGNADDAVRQANSLLCIGFGFRDQHIYPVIQEISSRKNIPIIILARKLSDEAINFLKHNAGKNYMGIEECPSGSNVYTPDNPCGTPVSTPNLWSLAGFCNLAL